MKAKEPASVYYTPSLSDESLPSFEERYQKAKEFARSHFEQDFVEYLEERNFMVDEPFPYDDKEESNLEKMFRESEESGIATDEEVKQAFEVWK